MMVFILIFEEILNSFIKKKIKMQKTTSSNEIKTKLKIVKVKSKNFF